MDAARRMNPLVFNSSAKRKAFYRWASPLVMAAFFFSCMNLNSARAAWPAPPQIAASHWLLADATTGQTLASKEAEKPFTPGSLTQLMTAYLTFSALRERRIRLDQNISAPGEAEVPQGARMFLTPGQSVPASVLLQGLLTIGANDSAVALAKAIAGSEAEFVDAMNKMALKLGMQNTQFRNATGAAHPEQLTTAVDLSKLALSLINEFPEHLREFGRREFTHNGIRQVNQNRLLWLDSSVDGLLTGRNDKEGYSTIISGHRPQPLGPRERMQRRLVAIVSGARSEDARSQEALKLLNFGFQQFDVIRLFRADEASETVPVFKGNVGSARLHFPKDVLLAVPRGQADRVRTQLERPNALLAPVNTGQPVGQLRIWVDALEVHQVPVTAAETVKSAGLLGRAVDTLRLWWQASQATR
jgi:D-alanyl-D-alanine carboxypeptidase (penicillin-binding protein 5/6)